MDTALNPDAVVTLREVTTENFRDILTLRVSPKQREYVASNDRSVAEAHFHQEAWFRAIYPGSAGPRGFYQKLGFAETGKHVGEEIEMRLEL
jgi:hypothetical protein